MIPVLGMAWEDYLREDGISSVLNWNPAKFQAGTIGVLILAVQVEAFPEEFNGRFFLKVNFAKNLEVTNIRYIIGSNILWMEFEKV